MFKDNMNYLEAVITMLSVIRLGKQPFCNHKKSHLSLSYGWCNNSHLGHCFTSVSYCFIKDVYIWIVCKCSVWRTESKCVNQTREISWQFENFGSSVTARKLHLLHCLEVITRRICFFKLWRHYLKQLVIKL